MIKDKQSKGMIEVSFLSFVTELAFVLSVPLIVAALIGHYIDKYTHNKFIFLTFFMLFAIILSCAMVVKKVSFVLKQINEKYEKQKQKD